MIDWPIVMLLLGAGGLSLGFYALRTSARRVTGLDELDHRLRQVEAKLPTGERQEPVLPRGLPRPLAR